MHPTYHRYSPVVGTGPLPVSIIYILQTTRFNSIKTQKPSLEKINGIWFRFFPETLDTFDLDVRDLCIKLYVRAIFAVINERSATTYMREYPTVNSDD